VGFEKGKESRNEVAGSVAVIGHLAGRLHQSHLRRHRSVFRPHTGFTARHWFGRGDRSGVSYARDVNVRPGNYYSCTTCVASDRRGKSARVDIRTAKLNCRCGQIHCSSF
jgi:hypothetical protein